MSAVKSRIDQLIKNHIVFVISKRTCPFCHTAKNILNKYDILPEQKLVLEIDGDKDCADIQDYMLQLTGGRTVPRVFIQGRVCEKVGCEESKNIINIYRYPPLNLMLDKVKSF